MFKNKIMNIAVIILICITLLVGAAIVLWIFVIDNNNDDPSLEAMNHASKNTPKKLSAEEIVALTTTLDNFATNTADPNYIVNISFAFQLENENTFDEFEKLKDIKVKPIVLKLLHETHPEELFGELGFDFITTQLINRINPILNKGKLVQVEITNFVIDEL